MVRGRVLSFTSDGSLALAAQPQGHFVMGHQVIGHQGLAVVNKHDAPMEMNANFIGAAGNLSQNDVTEINKWLGVSAPTIPSLVTAPPQP